MKKIARKPILRPLIWTIAGLAIGLLIAMAGAGPGGASAIFVFFGLLVGLVGTAVHGLLAFWKDRQKANLLWPVFSLALFSFFYMAEQSCMYTSQDARQMVISRLVKYKQSRGTLGGLDPQYLGEADTTKQGCAYHFPYEGNGRKLKLIFDRGKLFFDDLNER